MLMVRLLADRVLNESTRKVRAAKGMAVANGDRGQP